MPKRGNIRSKVFDLPIYTTKVIFVYSNSYDLIIEFMANENIDEQTLRIIKSKDYKGLTCCLLDKDRSYHYLIVLKDKDKYEEIDTISHEVLHMVGNILSTRGIKYKRNDDEPYAYLTGYLNKEFHKFKDERIK
jgi:hypothetical protein